MARTKIAVNGRVRIIGTNQVPNPNPNAFSLPRPRLIPPPPEPIKVAPEHEPGTQRVFRPKHYRPDSIPRPNSGDEIHPYRVVPPRTPPTQAQSPIAPPGAPLKPVRFPNEFDLPEDPTYVIGHKSTSGEVTKHVICAGNSLDAMYELFPVIRTVSGAKKWEQVNPHTWVGHFTNNAGEMTKEMYLLQKKETWDKE